MPSHGVDTLVSGSVKWHREELDELLRSCPVRWALGGAVLRGDKPVTDAAVWYQRLQGDDGLVTRLVHVPSVYELQR